MGLAKNTGKTETLAALLRELQRAGRRVGVTSVGRDGEEHDVIDFRIGKPRVNLPAQSLLASTDSLLSASGLPFELLQDTDIRTPLGRVLIVRLKGAGAVEVAGPSSAEQVREVADAMLASGADQVLIDGAIDRRAASRPDVADALVMSTGAVLAPAIEDVVHLTRRAVELVRLPTPARDSSLAGWLSAHEPPLEAALLSSELAVSELPDRFVLRADAQRIREMLAGNPGGRWLIVPGALPESFLGELAVVADPTRVFLSGRDIGWYAAHGVDIVTIAPIALLALTVNPVAPQSHTLDSGKLRRLLQDAIPDLPVFDVLHREYTGTLPAAPVPAH